MKPQVTTATTVAAHLRLPRTTLASAVQRGDVKSKRCATCGTLLIDVESARAFAENRPKVGRKPKA